MRPEEHGPDTDGQAPAPAAGELPPSPPDVKSLGGGVNLAPVTAPVTLKAGSTSELALQTGWNLVSLARQPGNPAPASAFSGAASRVFAYDACDAADPWKVWDPANPSASDLAAVSPKLGLWAEAPAAVILPVAGTEPAATTIHLCPGWNLIGAPFSQDRSVTGALSSIQGKYARVFGYDAADPGDPWEVYDAGAPAWANTLQVFEPGKGYWIFAMVETDLVLSNDTTGPIVQIAAPADLSEVTTITNVVGTVSGELIQEWRLAYRALGDAQWTLIASGTTPVVNGVLGVFDPTLLLNGPYQLELTATDANNLEQSFRMDIAVEGQQKIGNFTLTYSDLSVPLSGLPIQILRTYDSRDKRQGDFGIGWTLDIRQGSYKNNRPPGEGWQFASGFLPCQFIRESLGHVTTIRLSDREIYRFKLSLGSGAPTLGGCFAQARFDFVAGPVPGATLAILGNAQVLYQNGDNRVVDASSLEIYEPQAVRLTTRDGRIFDLTLQQGVTRIKEQNGNELSITASGITHSSGRTATFERDGQGRITRITDPEGESLVYEYNAAGDLVTVTDRAEQDTRFTYNTAHLLLDIEDARGIKPVRNEYDANGRLIRNVDAFDKVIEYTHDLANRQEIVTDRLGHSRLLEYDARGNVVREVDANGKETRRTFDDQDNVLTETDPLGHTTTHTYDASNNLTSIVDPLGNRTAFTYNAQGQELTNTSPRGKVSVNTYDAQGNLLSTSDPLGNTTTYTYDSHGNLLSRVDAGGAEVQLEYDLNGNLTSEADASGRETTYTYDRNGNLLTKTTSRTTPAGPESLVWRYSYDALGRIIQTTDPDGTFTRTTYDPLGRVRERIDKLDRRTTHTYDEQGRLVQTVFPGGRSETIAYDAEGRRTSVTDRGGRITRFEYDPAGRLLRTIYPDGGIFANGYDDAGRLVSSTDARNNITYFFYDPAGRRTMVRDSLGNEVTFGYNAEGLQTSTTDSKGQTTAFEYDDAGRLTLVRYPDGTTQESSYDRLGRKLSETDQAGATARYAYDNSGRLTSVTDALTHTVRYGWDEQGSKISQIDAKGHATYFEYDKLGRLTRRTLPLGASESLVYDAAGNLIRHTDFGGVTITREYDPEDRLTRRIYPDGSSVSFTYTATGQRESVVDARGVTTYAYDTRDRLAQVQLPSGQQLDYSYDLQGNRTGLAVDLGSSSLSFVYGYDALGRMITVTDPGGRSYVLEYDSNGNKSSTTYPNGVKTSYNYNRLNRLTDLSTRTSLGSLLQSYVYTLNLAGNRVQIAEPNGLIRSYEYDATSRLTKETVRSSSSLLHENVFVYDPVGNRVSQTKAGTGGSSTIQYSYDEADRLVSVDGAAYSWSQGGNLVGAEGSSYTYNFDNRLTRVARADGTVLSFAYDADGNRVRTEITPPNGPPEVIQHLIDPSGGLSQVVADIDGDSSLLAYYVRGDELLAISRPSDTSFSHLDGLGSIRLLTSETGEISDSYTFSAFGELLAHQGNDQNTYLFAGEAFEPDANLYYLRARWMDPATGRFISADPLQGALRSPLSLHRYAYAALDPVSKTDPAGLFTAIDINLALTVRSVVSETQVNVGFSIMDSVQYGGDRAIKNLLIGAAIPIVGVLAIKAVGGRLLRRTPNSGLMLPSGRPANLIANALEPHELAFAREILELRGGTLEGAAARKLPGIDGFLDNLPISLKEYAGDKPIGVLRHAGEAERKAANAGYEAGVEVFIKAKNVDAAALLDFSRKGALSQIPGRGSISAINVLTANGWVRLIN